MLGSLGVRTKPPGADRVVRHGEIGDSAPRHCQFGQRHLRKVLRLQLLGRAHGKSGIDFDFRTLLLLLPLRTLKQRLRHAALSGLRLLLLATRVRHWREHGDHLLHEIAGTPEQLERLVEHRMVLTSHDQHAVQRPVEIVPAADARSFHRAHRVHNGRWSQPYARIAQGAREIGDVVDESSFGLFHHTADARSDRTSRKISALSLPAIAAISS